ncbi:MAG: hypothetical protein ABIC57_01860, partial [bacterium]
MLESNVQKIVITGGGSGGHSMTSFAVVTKLLDKYPMLKEQMVFLGGNIGMEGENRSDSLDSR